MSHELFYTSAPKGLQPGSRGFCTVAATRGIPVALMEKLEALSGYRPLFPPHDAKADLNPVVYAHLRINAGGKTYSVLSRICAAGLDYTDRANKFAHHVALEGNDLPAGGPAWLLGQPGFMESRWDGVVRQLPTGRVPPFGNCVAEVCRAWQQATGDAGWGGVLAESFQHDPNRLVYLLFEPGMDLLPLLAEALALLPPEQRWEVTFSTYFTGLPQGTLCAWRCVPRGSSEGKAARKFPNALVLDLDMNLGPARGGALVARARGQAAAPVADGPGNGALGTVLAMEKATSAPPAELSATAPAPVSRPANDFSPPPLPSGGRARSSRGWLLSTTGGLAAGLLLSAGLVGVGYYSGVLRMPDEAESKETAPKGPSESSTVRPPTADADETKAELRRLQKQLEEKGKENQRLQEEQKKTAEDAKQKQKEANDQIAALQEKLKKTKGGKPKPVDPPKDPSLAEQLQDLVKAPQKDKLATIEKQVHRFVGELDQVHSLLVPISVRNYARLPSVIASRENEIPVPKELKEAKDQKEWHLRLLGLKNLQQDSKEPNKLMVFRLIGEGDKATKKRIAHFQRKENRLVFEWNDDRDREQDQEDRRAVRNAILEITKGGRPYLFGLMQVTSDPKLKLPLVVEFSKRIDHTRILERNKEERLTQDLFLASAGCELGDQMRVLRASADTSSLQWIGPDGKEEVLIKLTRIEGRPGEYQLLIQWFGKGEDPPRFAIHSLVAYTLVDKNRVEVWHLNASGK
jgi:hypothetical protein